MVAVCWGSIVAHILQPHLLKIAVEAKKSFGSGNIKHPPEDTLWGRHWFIFPHQLFPALGFAHESLDFLDFNFRIYDWFSTQYRCPPEIQKQIDPCLKSLDPFGYTQVMGKKSSTSRFDQRNNTMCDFALALLGRSRISKRGEFLLQKWSDNGKSVSIWEFYTFWYLFDPSLALKFLWSLKAPCDMLGCFTILPTCFAHTGFPEDATNEARESWKTGGQNFFDIICVHNLKLGSCSVNILASHHLVIDQAQACSSWWISRPFKGNLCKFHFEIRQWSGRDQKVGTGISEKAIWQQFIFSVSGRRSPRKKQKSTSQFQPLHKWVWSIHPKNELWQCSYVSSNRPAASRLSI